MVKYLFKYVCKGSDRTVVSLENVANRRAQVVDSQHTNQIDSTTVGSGQSNAPATIDEISRYLDCRYIGTHEAAWRLLQYDIHYSDPTVERLPVHLPDENSILFSDSQRIRKIAASASHKRTKLTAWFELNKVDELARELTYPECTKKFTWHNTPAKWARRKQNHRLARMHFVNPNAGELYYLRLLLNTVYGASSFEEIRTVNGHLHATFKAACEALGLLENDEEWLSALQEAAASANSDQLRNLFVEILRYCQVSQPRILWDNCWEFLGDDFLHRARLKHRNPQLTLPSSTLQNQILHALEKLLSCRGSCLRDFGLPEPTSIENLEVTNRLLTEQLSYNTVELQEKLPRLMSGLNEEQKSAFDRIVHSVTNDNGTLFFVYGHGGTGKTYLWQALTSFLRCGGRVVLTVASSGLASLLLPGGTTTYTRFKIPTELKEGLTCSIKKNMDLANLLKETALIIWDEAPMSNKICFEALDRTMKDILGGPNNGNRHKPFGGVTVVLGGDFRQTLPVATKGTRNDTVSASILNSYLWPSCVVLKLTINMRLTRSVTSNAETNRISKFADWLLSVGNGTEPVQRFDENEEENWIKIPRNLLLDSGKDERETIIATTYPNLSSTFNNIPFLQQRAIITPRNTTADELNTTILAKIPGEQSVYLSADSIDGSDNMADDLRSTFPVEFLNTVSSGSLPCHKLILKIGVPVMLLRNIDQPNGLCNGTRLIITALGDKVARGRIITGSCTDSEVYIPRIVFIHKDENLPFVLRRKQFLLCVCYAMTINKSQGQSLDMIGLYLPELVFSHGQLYVALSRTTTLDGLKILLSENQNIPSGYTRNVVYKEIFSMIGEI